MRLVIPNGHAGGMNQDVALDTRVSLAPRIVGPTPGISCKGRGSLAGADLVSFIPLFGRSLLPAVSLSLRRNSCREPHEQFPSRTRVE